MSYIVVSRTGKVGYLTLDRPSALNSLTHEMINDIHAGLRAHEVDDMVDVIVVRSSSDRAFCAGGDMKATRVLALERKWDELQHFFKKEYALNLNIAQCKKPYVSLVNGICMGGGLGLSAHGDVLLVSETSRLAMPETAIGFFPDVGGTYFMSRLPYDAGLWLGLTGFIVTGKEAVTVGLATHCVPEHQWPEIIALLESDGRSAITQTLDSLSDSTPDAAFVQQLEQRRAWFDTETHAQLVVNLTDASAEKEDAAKLLER